MPRHVCKLHARVEVPKYPGMASACRHGTDEQQLLWCDACATGAGICQICGENTLVVQAMFRKDRKETPS